MSSITDSVTLFCAGTRCTVQLLQENIVRGLVRTGLAFRSTYAHEPAIRCFYEAIGVTPQTTMNTREDILIAYRNLDEIYDLTGARGLQEQNLEGLKRFIDQQDREESISDRIDFLTRKAWLALSNCALLEAIALSKLANQLHTDAYNSLFVIGQRVMGIAQYSYCDYNAALTSFTTAFNACQKNSSISSPPDHLNLTRVHLARGEIQLAKSQSLIARSLVAHSTPKTLISKLCGFECMVESYLGCPEKALPYCIEGLTLARQCGDQDTEYWLTARHCELLMMTGQANHAKDLALHYFDLSASAHRIEFGVDFADVLAQCANKSKEVALAREWSGLAHKLALATEFRRYHLRSWIRLAEAHRLAGDTTKASHAVVKAFALLNELNQPMIEDGAIKSLMAS